MSIDRDKDDFFFSNDFEVTYDGDLSEVQSDIKNDAYKDVLSVLSELDDTHGFDYLEANKTRTIRIDEIEEYMQRQKEVEASSPFEKALESCKKFIHTITPGKK